MGIYILEDNIYQAKNLRNDISEILKEEHLAVDRIKIEIFHRPEELLKAVEVTGEHFNLYFLDLKIKSDENAGFLVGKGIRALEETSLICFVTSYANLALSSYDYGICAHAYIVKDCVGNRYFDQLRSCIQRYLGKARKSLADLFLFETKHVKVACPFAELLYIAPVSPHKLLIKTMTKEIYANGALKDFADFDPRLVRCHQSFVLNIANIKFLNKTKRQAVLINQTVIPISRKRYREVVDAMKARE